MRSVLLVNSRISLGFSTRALKKSLTTSYALPYLVPWGSNLFRNRRNLSSSAQARLFLISLSSRSRTLLALSSCYNERSKILTRFLNSIVFSSRLSNCGFVPGISAIRCEVFFFIAPRRQGAKKNILRLCARSFSCDFALSSRQDTKNVSKDSFSLGLVSEKGRKTL